MDASITPELRLLRYFHKMKEFRNDPSFMSDPVVRKVLDNGYINIQKVKQHFADRGILTYEQFDSALENIKTSGKIKTDTPEVTGIGLVDINNRKNFEIQKLQEIESLKAMEREKLTLESDVIKK